MNRTLVFGGARSGKSAHAESLAAASGKEVIHVAAADAGDAGPRRPPPVITRSALDHGGGRAAADDQGRPLLSGLAAGMLPALLRVRLTGAPGPGASAALPSAALYLWRPKERAELFWRTMAGHGIGVRLFKRGAGGIRCGLPPHEAGWRRLQAALQAWKET